MSRLKSGPAAKAGKPAKPAKPAKAGRGSTASRSTPAAGRGVFVQAPKSDIYVALLGVSLGAIIVGSLLLLAVWGRYGYAVKATGMISPWF